MEQERLTDICNPKQWKTIPTSDLLDCGYPVYGANGVIGYYSEYNHENPTVTITCRGATCGRINITAPKAYVTGNAMCLDDIRPDIDLKYLYYCLLHYDFSKVISGSAQPQITRQGLEKVNLRIGTPKEQQMVIAVLDQVKALIESFQRRLSALNNLLKARFVEMFGDPKTNPNRYKTGKLRSSCSVITGNTPPRSVKEYYGEYIEWIKTDNIVSGRTYPTQAVESLSETGMKVGRIVDEDAILMACIAGSITSIGRVCITDRRVAFNQQINAIVPKLYDVHFLYVLLQTSKDYLVEEINMALKGILSKSKLEDKEFYIPPMELQKQFADFLKQVDKSKVAVQKALDKTQHLFDSLMQKYFG